MSKIPYRLESQSSKPLMDVEDKSPLPDDSGPTATLMPGRVRALQMRAVAWFLLVWGSIMGIYVAQVVGFDFYVRSHWHLVEGEIVRYEEKTAQIGSLRSRPSHWIEFEVEFDPKEWGCNTGMSWAVAVRFPCIGIVKTPSSQSWDVARSWVPRHRVASPAKFFYDPPTGHLRFAGELVFYLPWGAVLAFIGATGIGAFLLWASGRRLEDLKTMPDTPTETPIRENRASDELTDLNLP